MNAKSLFKTVKKSKHDFFFSDFHNYYRYFAKSRIWYYRKSQYEDLCQKAMFKNYHVENSQSYIRLTPIRRTSYSNLINRDFHQAASTDLDLGKSLEYQLDNFDITETIDNEKDVYDAGKEYNNIGIFWLFGGDNKRRIINDLFEYNNLIPNNNNNYILHFEQAPLNPFTNESHVIEHNFFDIFSLPDFNGNRFIDKKEIDQQVKILESKLNSFINECNIDKVIIAGFSQGGSMSLHLGLSSCDDLFKKIKGIISLSAFAFDFTPLDVERLKSVQILLLNGLNDDIVPIREARDRYSEIKKLLINKSNVNIIEEPGLYHSFSESSLENIKEFINKI